MPHTEYYSKKEVNGTWFRWNVHSCNFYSESVLTETGTKSRTLAIQELLPKLGKLLRWVYTNPSYFLCFIRGTPVIRLIVFYASRQTS